MLMTRTNQGYGDGCWLIITLFCVINRRKEKARKKTPENYKNANGS
jgi:hypothetical protein